MKILKLTFQNINSLYGKWTIDFEDPAYTTNGIFVLTGPTGSGKSTVLDAICLSLYGKTPRISSITKDKNDVMSHNATECFAELIFEANNVKYRTSWTQSFARTGNLRDYEHEIYDETTGAKLSHSKSDVPKMVAKISGLDYEQFKKTVMLAQGEFASFLKANGSKKAEIFEKVTGTKIYSDISREVHERKGKAKKDVEEVEEKLKGVEILSDEDFKVLEQKKAEYQIDLDKVDEDLERVGAYITWRGEIKKNEEKLENIGSQIESLRKEIEDFQPEKERLLLAERAANLDGAFSKLVTEEEARNDTRASLSSENEKLPDLEKSFGEAEKAYGEAEKKKSECDRRRDEERKTLIPVRKLDTELAGLQASLKEKDGKILGITQEIEKLQGEEKELAEKISDQERELQKLDSYFTENAADKELGSALVGLEAETKVWNEAKKDVSVKEKALSDAEEEYQKAVNEESEAQTAKSKEEGAYRNACAEREEAEKELAALLDGQSKEHYEERRKSLNREMQLHTAIRSLEEHRGKLEDGKPCPCCGSTTHPYAEGNIPSPDETEKDLHDVETRLAKIEELREKVDNARTKENTANSNHLNARSASGSATQRVAAKKVLLDKAEQELGESKEKQNQAKREIGNRLQPFGVALTDSVSIEQLIQDLKTRAADWDSNQTKKNDLINSRAALEKERVTITAKLQGKENERTAVQNERNRDDQTSKEKSAERKLCYGEKSPDEEEKKLNDDCEKAESELMRARQTREAASLAFEGCKTLIANLNIELRTREDRVAEQTASFNKQLAEYGFTDRKALEEARLDPNKRKELSERREELEHRFTSLKTLKEYTNKVLNELKEEKKTERSEDELTADKESLTSKREDLNGKYQADSLKLALAEKNRKEYANYQNELKTKKEAFEEWDELHKLIGSDKGEKYSRFVQSLTLDIVLHYANEQLQKIAGRYCLVKGSNLTELDIDVIDYNQAGEVRTTKNLSGGEQFIVSLALALGISRIASRNIKIDTLFLDEGFGTLDENVLDLAISALEVLQQEGKMIGIITHVKQLQGDESRIETKIHVKPKGDGSSTLEGPGVAKLSGFIPVEKPAKSASKGRKGKKEK